jgi:nitroreductase
VSELTSEEIEKIKYAATEDGIAELIRKRWSPRAFSDKEVSSGELEKLFLAASWAASSYNEQPWRFFAGRRGDETHKKIFHSLMEFNQQWASTAPVLLLSVGKKTFTQNGNPNPYALHDTGAATAYLALEATALGMHAHSMGGFDKDVARASFGVPSDFEIGAVTAVGYLGDPSTLSDYFKKADTSPRSRKPLAEFVFSAWDQAAKL